MDEFHMLDTSRFYSLSDKELDQIEDDLFLTRDRLAEVNREHGGNLWLWQIKNTEEQLRRIEIEWQKRGKGCADRRPVAIGQGA